jgi:hypothetical protein
MIVPGPRLKGHLVARVSWARLEVECTCGESVTADSEAGLMAAFSTHRRTSPPEPHPPMRRKTPPLVPTGSERAQNFETREFTRRLADARSIG